MPNFDLDTYFANKEARTLGVATPEGVIDLNAKQAQVAAASAKKVQVLQELVERRETNERDTVVGWLGLDPNSTGGNVVNTAVSSLSAIEDIAGTVAPEAVSEAIDMDGLIATQHDGTKPSSIQRRLMGDGAVSGLKSAIAVPEMAVGLADLVSQGHAGKYLEEAGFKPEEAKQFLPVPQGGRNASGRSSVLPATAPRAGPVRDRAFSRAPRLRGASQPCSWPWFEAGRFGDVGAGVLPDIDGDGSNLNGGALQLSGFSHWQLVVAGLAEEVECVHADGLPGLREKRVDRFPVGVDQRGGQRDSGDRKVNWVHQCQPADSQERRAA